MRDGAGALPAPEIEGKVEGAAEHGTAQVTLQGDTFSVRRRTHLLRPSLHGRLHYVASNLACQ
ncbi:MAG: hypothetical protein N2116_00740 [Armatimonadetes bacterium]|nr:hypothetical protein [Armatimonadota bacterium]